jgi:transposase
MRIRKVKNSSGNTSVQVGYYQGKNFQLIKHIGSARNPEQLESLIQEANALILHDQPSIFDQPFESSDIQPLGYKRTHIYKYLSKAFSEVFTKNIDNIFKNLVIARIIHPSSKQESLELLNEYFSIKYSKSAIHRHLLKLDKQQLISSLVDYAKGKLSFDFSLVFYDVTTLYFESKADEKLKIAGFSKDGKHSNPQIMIGLVVDKNGFPITYEIFKGNTFEGHTMIPVLMDLKQNFRIDNLTVVADSAMLSESNLSSLESSGFNYIVGNRTISTYRKQIDQNILKVKLKDNSTFKVLDGSRYVIYHYSLKREKKDLFEIQKAIKRAEYLSQNPAKRSKAKYLKVTNEKSEINIELIEKHKFLAGIKSYKTNIDLPSNLIVERYSDLWRIEKAFRMSKKDLKARPIFHRKADAIKAHIQIVFAANAVAKHIEMNTGKSIQRVVKEKLRIIEVIFKHKDSNQFHSFELTPH